MTVGDTNAISQGVGAFASRQAINAGNSAMMAGESVKRQVIALASRRFRGAGGRNRRRGRPRGRPRRQQAGADLRRTRPHGPGDAGLSVAPGQTPGLEHTAYFTPPQASYCNGTHVAEVEVDPMTGAVTILNTWSATTAASSSIR